MIFFFLYTVDFPSDDDVPSFISLLKNINILKKYLFNRLLI